MGHGESTSPWTRRALHVLLGVLALPLLVAAILRGSEDAPSPARGGGAPAAPLWHQGRARGRPIELAPASEAPAPAAAGSHGPLPATLPSLTSVLEGQTRVRPAELAAPPAAVDAWEPADPGDTARDASAQFLDTRRVVTDTGNPESYGRLATRIVGDANLDSLGRSEKLQAARLFLAAGRYSEAWDLYVRERPARFGREIALEAIMVAIAAGRAADGLDWYGDLAARADDRTAYWWARLAQRANRDDLARPVLEELAHREPRGYYAIWAEARLRDSGVVLSPVVLDGRASREDADVPLASVALVELADLAHRHGAAVGELERALAFAQAGSYFAAAQELRQAFRLRPGTFDRADEAIVARVARVLGDEELALRLQPAEDLRDYHRHAWRDLVIAAAGRHGVDPDLVWSVMLRESYFRPNAASPAGALGLMQIMPETGRAIARELGVTGFKNTDLLDPDCAIDFGTFLIAGLLHRYGGNVPVAIAAYNAGIGPVDEWLAARRGVEADVFAELVPYPETHRYVQRVLTSLALYQSTDRP